MKTREFSLVIASAIPFLCQSFPAFSQETAYGHIIAFQTGSLGGPPSLTHSPIIGARVEADDTVAVNLDVPFQNSREPGTLVVPGVACKITTGSYALDPKDTGVKLNESVLLSAYLAGKKVRLELNGCVFDKPRIISVQMSAGE